MASSVPSPDYESHLHEPLQLIQFIRPSSGGNTTISLSENHLDAVLTACGDRPLCIICVCGPSRQGKSFVLGYMIRCLEALEKDEDDWLQSDQKTKPLHGFKFRNGTSPETQGIWIWSRPFIVKTDSGKEVAVLLLDTQGTQDEFTTNKDMSAIVGLSLLTSSIMIFNFFNNLQEDTLAALNTYLQYGLLALERDTEISHPFQKLTFLIRDWNIPSEFPYGGKGGKEFLEHKLKIKEDQPPEAKEVRNTIKKCFKDLDCFLLPFIGDKALAKDFSGSLAELAPLFVKRLEEFISNLISSETLVPKEILGNLITAEELKDYLRRNVEILNSEEMPTAASMWEGAAEAQLNGVFTKSLKKYHDIIKKGLRGSYATEEKLEECHTKGEKEAGKLFKSTKKFGSDEKKADFEEMLFQQIQKDFQSVKKQNEDKRVKYITGATTEGATAFKKFLEDDFPLSSEEETEFYEEKNIKKEADFQMSELVENFKEKLSSESDEEIEKQVKTFESVLMSFLESHVDKNKICRMNAEKAMEGIVSEISEGFKAKLEKFLENHEFAEVETLEDEAKSGKEEAVEEFQKRNKPGKKEFHQGYLPKLEEDLKQVSEGVANGLQLKLQQIQINADEFIREHCEQHEEKLREVAELNEDESEVEQRHEEDLQKILNEFELNTNRFPTSSSHWRRLNERLESELKSTFDKVVRDVLDQKRCSEESYKNAVETSLDHYEEAMEEILESAEFIEDKDLEVEHDLLLKETLEMYENTEKIGVPDDALNYKIGLKTRIQKRWEEIQEANKTNKELAYQKAVNFVNDCEREYEKIMKQKTEELRQMEEFEEAHLVARDKVVEMFRGKNIGKDEIFLKEFIEKLEMRVDECFEEIRDFFEMKRTEDEVAFKGMLIDVRKYYHEEMKKNLINNLFVRPAELEGIHENVSRVVVGKLEVLKPLTMSLRMDLEQEMEGLFEKYKMENDMRLNSEVAPAIGIDLGTTYCCVSVYYKGEVRIIPNLAQGDEKTTPSYVAFNADGTESYGHPAKANAYKNPEYTIYDAKRIIGRRMDDEFLQADMKFWPFSVVEEDGTPKIDIHGRFLHPEQISGKLLAEFRLNAEKFLKLEPGTIKAAVITVPAYFTDGQRQATLDAGELGGFERSKLTILNEPTAAAIAYTLQRLDTGARRVLVFDLGGGTFDVAILNVKPGSEKSVEVIGVGGDTHLGGQDFDHEMMKYCAQQFEVETGINLLAQKDSADRLEKTEAKRALMRLQNYCEKSKKELSSGKLTEVSIDGFVGGEDLGVEVSRDKFEELNEARFQQTIDVVEKTLEKYNVRKEMIEDIVLVGGSTRIPKVQELLKTIFDGRTLTYSVNPDEAVAYGAAIQAALLNGTAAKEEFDFDTIQDVTSLSKGIEAIIDDVEGQFSVIIPAGTKLPVNRKEPYYTSKHYQTQVSIVIYEGEDSVAKRNKLLGKFVLEGIPPGPQGKEVIDVCMQVNTTGVLHVEASCRSTKGKNSITVKEDKQRMSRDQIRKLLEDEDPAIP